MIWVALVLLFIIIDQLTKLAAVRFSWSIFYNNNFAFSLPVPLVLMYLIYFFILASIAIYIYRTWKRFSNQQKFAWCLVCSGGLSNIGERIVLGSVRDFIPIINGMWNIADFFILIGLVLLLVSQRYGVHKELESNIEKLS